LDYAKEPKTYTVRCNDENISTDLVNLRFSKKLYLPNNIALLLLLAAVARMIPSRALRARLISRSAYLKRIAEAHLVAGVCGGDSFSDIYGLTRLIYVTLPLLLSILLERKVILLPQTYGPFKGRIARAIARNVVRSSYRTYARDHMSHNTLEALVGEETVAKRHAFCYDMAFALDPCAPVGCQCGVITKNRDVLLVGLNVSGLLWMGGYDGKNMFGLKSEYRQTILKLIDYLMSIEHVNLLLIPHVFGEGSNSESDVSACRQVHVWLAERYGDRIKLVAEALNQSEIKYVIGRCDFFVGSRMHACIAALSQCVPAVSIAYSDKFRGVMETLGQEITVVDARVMTSDEIVKMVQVGFENRDRTKAALTRRIPGVRETVLGLLNGLVQDAPESSRKLLVPAPVG